MSEEIIRIGSRSYSKTFDEYWNRIMKLEQENKQLKEALETKFYCQYANKCNELYDCTREEYETMTQSNMKLNLEKAEAQEKINKAIEYIKEHYNLGTKEEGVAFFILRDRLLEILGDKE